MKVDVLISDWDHPQFRIFFDSGWVGSLVKSLDVCVGGDFLFLVCCTQIVPREVRQKYRYCLVLHESDLPLGRGWSPLAWQVLEGRKVITVSMVEAEDRVDSGKVWMKDAFGLEGHEVNSEIHELAARLKVRMMETAIANHEQYAARASEQTGPVSYYPRRTPEDSRVWDRTTVGNMFDLLRVADARFPVFFDYRGHRYYLTMEKA